MAKKNRVIIRETGYAPAEKGGEWRYKIEYWGNGQRHTARGKGTHIMLARQDAERELNRHLERDGGTGVQLEYADKWRTQLSDERFDAS